MIHLVPSYPSKLLLEELNMILPAWKTEEWVDGDRLSGARTRYGYIHPVNGANVGTNPSTIEIPYPYEIEHFERTYDESGVLLPGVWEDQLKYQFHHLSNRKPKAIRIENWPHDAELTWSNTGQLEDWKYEDYERHFTYHSDFDLIIHSEEIDQTSNTFTYDEFLRLKTILDDQRGVTKDGVTAERGVPVALRGVDAAGRLEPLTVLIDEADGTHRHSEESRDGTNHHVEVRFGGGVEDCECPKTGNSARVV